MNGGRPLAQLPSIDLAVVAFPGGARGGHPVAANVLFSRDHPRGLMAEFEGGAQRLGAVSNVHYLADQRDAKLDSIAWFPGADWNAMRWVTLAGSGPDRFVAPYPASLLKVMVAVGVGLAVDRGLVDWPEAAMRSMITVSDNDATTEMVALLHRHALIEPLHRRFEDCGLTTLRLRGTQPDGGWGNAAGAGVGQIQMTAWDSLRLMWLLDADAPPPPWLSPGKQLLSPAAVAKIRGWLDAQQGHEILNARRHLSLPGWVPGIPTEVNFAHKTGTTENYASDAGIARGRRPLQRHYLVAMLSSLGSRYAPHPDLATTWRLPSLGAAIDALLAPWLESADA
jgi:Beta-lactamase enzyme family